MADPHSDDEITERSHSTPRWVKVFLIVILAIAALIVIAMAIGGPGGHGPGRHLPSGGPTDPVPISSVIGAGAPVVAGFPHTARLKDRHG